jgi:hypothetical protein
MDAAITATELAVAAPQVVAARLAMGAAALSTPSAAANAEATRMVMEKTQAFAEGGLAASAHAGRIGADAATYLMAEAAAATSLFTNPFGAAQAAGRFYDYWSGLTRAGLQMQAAAMAPVHKAATANARRLKR